jgi:two-component system response regulator AtoC
MPRQNYDYLFTAHESSSQDDIDGAVPVPLREGARRVAAATGADRPAGLLRAESNHNKREAAALSPESFLGRSPQARHVRELLRKLSGVPYSALVVCGESGVGKGVVARILHHSGSRLRGPLIELNCAALPRELIESELFGHEAGAFTNARGLYRGLLEQAHGGTMFFDEISELELDLQSKLLKAVEDKRIRRIGGDREIEIDIQIIAATNRDLHEEVKAGRFRSDLYHRLNVIRLNLAPLRDRIVDLEDYVPLFIEEFNKKAGKVVEVVPESVWAQLWSYHWPGNVRELRNVIERCVLFSENEVFPAQWMQLDPVDDHISTEERRKSDIDHICLPLDGSMGLEDMDKRIIQATLERHEFNVTATARALSTTRETLRYRINKHGLSVHHKAAGSPVLMGER